MGGAIVFSGGMNGREGRERMGGGGGGGEEGRREREWEKDSHSLDSCHTHTISYLQASCSGPAHSPGACWRARPDRGCQEIWYWGIPLANCLPLRATVQLHWCS